VNQVRIAKIVRHSRVDGPGCRTVIFMQGCVLHCPGCQNKHLWPLDGGQEWDVHDLVSLIDGNGEEPEPITISGGEPFLQPEAMVALILELRLRCPSRHVIVYSGYTLEQLLEVAEDIDENIFHALALADVLVDGPYIRDLDHDRMQWRGSSNQRAIDLVATLDQSRMHDPVLLDWDTPRITVTRSGSTIAAAGVMESFFGEAGQPTRMCGQTTS